MTYARSAFGPGNIGALRSGIGLTQGPTIGSNDAMQALGWVGATTMQRMDRSAVLPSLLQAHVVGPTKIGLVQVGSRGQADDTNYVLTDTTVPTTDETLTSGPEEDRIVVPEDSGIPVWVWIVGGVAGLGLIGGLAWWALK
jgi:hypothetical protein